MSAFIVRLSLCFVTMLGLEAFAAEEHTHAEGESCEHSLAQPPKIGKIVIQQSGRQHAEIKALETAVVELSEIAANLGYAFHNHKLVFATSQDLSSLVSVGGFAAPYWGDGQKIVEGGPGLAGVMEFVVGGCPSCRSFYRDTTEHSEQISIVAHVLGHNDVGLNSLFKARGKYDAVAASNELSQLMSRLYEKFDIDRVSHYRQLLETLANSGFDYAHGTFDKPEDLKRVGKSIEDLRNARVETPGLTHDKALSNPYPIQKWPVQPTGSIFASYIASLPEYTDDWKREMAKLVFETYSEYPGNVQIKIMNEGWATFSQILLIKHSKYRTQDNIMRYAGLMNGVTGKDKIANPYWLGLQAWQNLYAKFRNRPDIQAISDEMAKDRIFVAEAHGLMGQLNDYQFIRHALDESWVKKNKLFLHRKLLREDYGTLFTDANDMNKNIVLSIDHRRIIDTIARQLSDRSLTFPRVLLHDAGFKGDQILLRQDDVSKKPLEKFSAAQTAYVMAKLFGRTVTLDMLGSSAWVDDKIEPVPRPIDDEFFFFPMPRPMGPQKPELRWVRVQVSPDGEIHVFRKEHKKDAEGNLLADTEFVENARLNELLFQGIAYYIKDLTVDLNPSQVDAEFSELVENLPGSKELLLQMRNAITARSVSIENHAPTASKAVNAYQEILSGRLAAAIGKILSGTSPMVMGKTGVRVRALPIVPSFRFDSVYVKNTRSWKYHNERAPVDKPGAKVDWDDPALDDVGVDLGFHGNVVPGDIFGKKKKPGQGGDEEGDEDGDEEGEPDDQIPEKDPDKPEDFDGGPGDPSVVEIPADLWQKLFLKKLELPNLRKTKADAIKNFSFEMTDPIRNNDPSRLREDELVEDAIEAGIAMDPASLKKRPGETQAQRMKRLMLLFQEGLKVIEPDDYPIRSVKTVPEPESKAVVVFVIDLTGSMMGVPQELSKTFVGQVVQFLEAHYKTVEVRYVGYDDKAHEFTKEEIFKVFLGGGNTDSEGFKLADTILDEYDQSYSRYVYGIGDGGSSDTELTLAALNSIKPKVQHMAWVLNNARGWHDETSMDFVAQIKALADKSKWMDFTKIKDQSTIVKALYDLFSPEANRRREAMPEDN